MNKRVILNKIIATLVGELEIYFRAAQFSRAEATHESSKAESKYDTRGLEASYLARGQSKQAAEIEAAIAEFEKLPVKKFGADDPIDLGALVNLEQGGEKYFTSSARAPAARKCCMTKRKFSSSPRNHRWVNSSWAKDQAIVRNSPSADRNKWRKF